MVGSRREDAVQLVARLRALARDAVPGQADRQDALRGEAGVAPAVGVEGTPGAVRPCAGELDDDALALEQRVDGDDAVDEGDGGVHPRGREAAVAAEPEERPLELVAGRA